jgi:hypothetical protein
MEPTVVVGRVGVFRRTQAFDRPAQFIYPDGLPRGKQIDQRIGSLLPRI